MLVGGNGLVTWSEQQVPSGIAALVVATVPLWMTFLDWLSFQGPRPGRRTVAGLMLGLFGIALLIGPQLLAETTGISAASWLILFIAPALWSIGSLRSRRADLPANPFMATAVEMLDGGALLLVAGLLTGEGPSFDPAGISLRSSLALLYLTFFGFIVALTAYVWLLRRAAVSRVATYTYVNPVIAVFLGWLVLGERVDASIVIAASIIIAAVVLITTFPAQRPAPATEGADAIPPQLPALLGPNGRFKAARRSPRRRTVPGSPVRHTGPGEKRAHRPAAERR